ncbi:cytochrome P450 [Laetiporus sulphureus 93-53]|uniref:Cytochrome P450 n=1 Tax=Laetiporus sulphureus 93-53 TaxID=1314785 RepID=A0A165HDH7_9APHY|nr:cytochrome P450 [Laetiporus sulphureus 93-53]KZT11592.1 cytochrome P450 [Laetiporus sulphureus 93-53]
MGLTIVTLALILGTVLATVYFRLSSNKDSLPSGPPGHWLLGNAPSGPHASRRVAELVEAYGPVITLRYGIRLVCVVGRYEAAVDILQKHSLETSDRPRAIVANEILSKGLRVLMVRAGDRLKRIRRALHAYLQPSVAVTYTPIQYRYAKKYIVDCYRKPDEHLEHAKSYAASLVLTIAYGKTSPSSYSDPDVRAINKYLQRLTVALRPGAYLVESFPFLKYIPGYLSHFHRWQREENALFASQLEAVRRKMEAGEAESCFAAYLIENQERLGLSYDEMVYVAGAVFGAGSDTTAAALGVVTMAAACYPEAQKAVQAQLDQVVGRGRLPSFEDQDMLPEVTAFVLESFRWRPVSVGGFSHRTMKDVIWRNYVIPAGTEIVGNHWAISRDPEVYPDPETFNPRRWLDGQGRLRDDLKFFNFGFGRRVCIGQHVANNSLFINTALILWAFSITQNPSKPIDTFAFTDSANSHPLPFSVSLQPRVKNLEELLGITVHVASVDYS